MGDIGKEKRWIEVLPAREPTPSPAPSAPTEPAAPKPAPAAPARR